MIRRKALHPVFKNFTYDSLTNISNCLIEGCSFPRTTGKHQGNLVKHIVRNHGERGDQLKKEIVDHLTTKHSSKSVKEENEETVIAKISRKEFLISCLEFVVINGRPFKIFEDTGFLK